MWLGLIAGSGLACATVTQEDPPSNQTGSQGGGGSTGLGGASQGGSSNGGSNPGSGGSSPAFGGSTASGGTGGSNSGNGGTGGISQGGTAGATGQGGSFSPPLNVDGGRPPGMVLVEDNFDNFVASDWTNSGGTWTAAGGTYSQTNNTSNDPFLSAVDGSFTDFRAQVDFNVTAFNGGSSSYMAGLCVRVVDAGNFYMVGLRSNNGNPLQLRRFGGDNEGILADSDVDQSVGVTYQLRVDVIGSTIAAYLNGELMFSHVDAELTEGGVALCNSRSSVTYDNFVVTDAN